MLVPKSLSLKAGDVIALKPLTGPDIIGRLHSDYDGGPLISLRKPIEAHVVQGQKGELGLAFSPFSLSAKDDHVFHIPRDKLMVDPFLARDEVKTTYSDQTSSLKI